MIKRILAISMVALLISSCKSETTTSPAPPETTTPDLGSYTSVGEKITGKNALSASEMYERYNDLEIGDTIDVKFVAEVSSVCQEKGCWMKLKLPEGAEATIKFKDYSFFVPKDIKDKEVVVSGIAFISEASVEERRHLAEDAGKSPEEVETIQKGEKTFSFMAEGVLIKS